MAERHWLHGLHVDPWDNVWVTDVSRHLVMKFDPAGALALCLGVDGESGCDDRRFAQPTHVCVLPSGEFFVTDGTVGVPSAPGLGVHLPPELIAKYRFAPRSGERT